jgi:hypothetical protein
MAKLRTRTRKSLPENEFALPGGKYPVEDKAHAAMPKREPRSSTTPGS